MEMLVGEQRHDCVGLPLVRPRAEACCPRLGAAERSVCSWEQVSDSWTVAPAWRATPKPACWSTRSPASKLPPMQTRAFRERTAFPRLVRPISAITGDLRACSCRCGGPAACRDRTAAAGRQADGRPTDARTVQRGHQPRRLNVAVDLRRRCVVLAAGCMVRSIALSSTGAMNLDHAGVMCDLS